MDGDKRLNFTNPRMQAKKGFWFSRKMILEVFSSLNDCTIFSPDIRHPEELSLLRKPRDPSKKKKKKLDDQCDDEAFELEGPLITPGSGEPKHTLQGCAYGEQGRRGS